MAMKLTDAQKRIIEQTINVFETGSRKGNYSAVSLYEDGPKGCRQITYGRSQTTEFSNLAALIQKYVDTGGSISTQFEPYLGKIGKDSLVNDKTFISLLKQAGSDPKMCVAQDDFFDEHYYMPALKWADTHGFEKPLSLLVIYDSFIHSGKIHDFLRNAFPETTPSNGGNERAWICAYIAAREKWLLTAKNPALRPTVYRMKCMKNQIAKDNWGLDALPIETQGVKIWGDAL